MPLWAWFIVSGATWFLAGLFISWRLMIHALPAYVQDAVDDIFKTLAASYPQRNMSVAQVWDNRRRARGE